MPFLKPERLPNEPIFVITYQGIVTAEDIVTSMGQTALLWSPDLMTTGSHIITDARTMTSNFKEIVATLHPLTDLAKNLGDIMQYVRFYVVATDPMSKLFVNFLQQKQFGGYAVPMFSHLEDALDAVRQAVTNWQPSSTGSPTP